MSDLISRQAVMDTTKTVMKDILDSLPIRLEDGEEVYDVRTSELDLILGINKALQNAIKALPSETHDKHTETHGVCSDAISRQAAIDALKEHRALYCDNTPDTFSKLSYAEKSRVDELDTAIATIVNLPSAQPERKRGEWEEIEVIADAYDISGVKTWASKMKCDQCGFTTIAIEGRFSQYNFCPNCGADMRGGGNESD